MGEKITTMAREIPTRRTRFSSLPRNMTSTARPMPMSLEIEKKLSRIPLARLLSPVMETIIWLSWMPKKPEGVNQMYWPPVVARAPIQPKPSPVAYPMAPSSAREIAPTRAQ